MTTQNFANITRPLNPVFWHASYPMSDDKYLKIPFCLSCNNSTRIINDKCIKCDSPNITFNKDNGSIHIEMNEMKVGEKPTLNIFEFGPNGESFVNFVDLPLDNMEFFGLMNTAKGDISSIDLKTGEFIFKGHRIGVTVPRTLSEDRIGNFIIGNRSHLDLSRQEYDYRGSLFHFKTCRKRSFLLRDKSKNDIFKQMDPKMKIEMHRRNQEIESYSAGYICHIGKRFYAASIVIDSMDYLPRMGIKCCDDTEDILH